MTTVVLIGGPAHGYVYTLEDNTKPVRVWSRTVQGGPVMFTYRDTGTFTRHGPVYRVYRWDGIPPVVTPPGVVPPGEDTPPSSS